jgi:hypothetical protein
MKKPRKRPKRKKRRRRRKQPPRSVLTPVRTNRAPDAIIDRTKWVRPMPDPSSMYHPCDRCQRRFPPEGQRIRPLVLGNALPSAKLQQRGGTGPILVTSRRQNSGTLQAANYIFDESGLVAQHESRGMCFRVVRLYQHAATCRRTRGHEFPPFCIARSVLASTYDQEGVHQA